VDLFAPGTYYVAVASFNDGAFNGTDARTVGDYRMTLHCSVPRVQPGTCRGQVLYAGSNSTGTIYAISDTNHDLQFEGQTVFASGTGTGQLSLASGKVDIAGDFRIRKNTALAAFPFRMTDSADHVTPKTGLTVTGQVSLNGGAFAGLVEIIPGSSNEDWVLFHLPDGEVLEAMIGSPKLPPFIGGLWASTLLFLFVSITLLGVWAGRALSSPLSAFARAAESFSLGRSSAPLPETGPEEIRAAAKALNRMRDRITVLMNDRTRMLAAISHDLRTPITRLRLRSEYVEDETRRAETLRDLDQMQSMLESVLSLFRSGSAGRPTLVDAAALLQMICEQFSDFGHAVTYEGSDRFTLVMRPEEISRAVTNLVENAVRFGTVVTVRLAVSSDQATIEVSDDGPGIPDERKPAMLEPFVRGEEARTMDETSGFGLGLSIAQAVVHAHGGTLSLHDNDPHGLLARIVIPKNETLKD